MVFIIFNLLFKKIKLLTILTFYLENTTLPKRPTFHENLCDFFPSVFCNAGIAAIFVELKTQEIAPSKPEKCSKLL